MDKLDIRLLREQTASGQISLLNHELIFNELERLQEREAAQDAIIEMRPEQLRSLRNTIIAAIPPGDVAQLFNEVRRLAKVVAERNAELIEAQRAREGAIDALKAEKQRHSTTCKVMEGWRQAWVALRDEALAKQAPPAPVEGCKLTAEQVESFKSLCTEGERWMHGDCDLYLSKPYSSAMSRVAAFFSAGVVPRVADVLNALPDLLHDITVLRSECEHLRRRAIAAEKP